VHRGKQKRGKICGGETQVKAGRCHRYAARDCSDTHRLDGRGEDDEGVRRKASGKAIFTQNTVDCSPEIRPFQRERDTEENQRGEGEHRHLLPIVHGALAYRSPRGKKLREIQRGEKVQDW